MVEQGELNFGAKPREEDHEWFLLLDAKVVADFWAFHARHPNVFEMFLRFAREAKSRGRGRFGAAMIIQRIRWYVRIEQVGTEGETFKIHDHLGACYSRLTMIRHPEFEDFFEIRSSNRRGDDSDGED